MLPTIKPLIVVALAALLYFPADLAAETAVKPQKVCVSKTNELIVRARCKKGEKTLTRPAIDQKLNETVIAAATGPVGPIGPIGEIGPLGQTGPKGEAGGAGVKGAKGLIDFSGCRKVSAPREDNVDGSVEKISISASCIPNVEFIYDDQYSINIFSNSVGTKAVVQSRASDSVAGDNRDYFVEYTMKRIASVGLGLYSVDLLVFCCPL
jgi:hypothetical protein